ncbi:MAG: thiamine-phosphate kinase [Planctomycetota bacterium]|nr:thiamine-phosphate kinase [Planctomycetota bacterium]
MEREFVRWIAERADAVGDDCAVLDCEPWGALLVTVDGVIDGIHLRREQHGLQAFGYKAVARGLSDIAAMGGEPLWAVLAATLPRGAPVDDAKAVFLGAEDAGCRIVGGDTATGPVLSVTATVLGKAPARGAVLRSGARVGDWIVATGSFGRSLATGHHATFQPRVAEARALLERCDVGAMIDVSDGLSTDLLHIVEASGVGCRLDGRAVPRRDRASLQEALDDGEDYELLATVRPGTLPDGFRRIGEITESDAVLVADGEHALVAGGWEHGA